MTLSTDLIICEPINPERVFQHALSLLSGAVLFEPKWRHTPAGESRGFGDASFATEVGQGLPAWLWVHYATDGPLRIWDEERLGWEHDPNFSPPWFDEHCLRVNVDTGYAYKTPEGAGCRDLHAWFLASMIGWLEGQGVTKWVWQNEFTGEYHDSQEALYDLGDPLLGALPSRSSSEGQPRPHTTPRERRGRGTT